MAFSSAARLQEGIAQKIPEKIRISGEEKQEGKIISLLLKGGLTSVSHSDRLRMIPGLGGDRGG